jgi:hypothetical protein
MAAEPCSLSTLQGDQVGDLAIGYRARGLDVRECEGKRRLAAQTLDAEHALEDEQVAARAERNRSFWSRLMFWRKATP